MRRVFRLPLSSSRVASEVDDELSFHLEMRAEKLMRAGLSREAAEAEALRQFGNLGTVRQSMVSMDHRRERRIARANVFSEFTQDVRSALRSLRQNVGFTAMVVAILAIGIGANTSIFTLVDAVLMRSLPVEHPEQLVAIGKPTRVNSLSEGTPRTDIISAPLYRDIRANNQVFTDVLATGRSRRLDARIDEHSAEPEHPSGRYVSSNYFTLLGVKALHGRVLESRMDDVPGSSPVVVISHGYWTRRFNNDPSAIGRVISLHGVEMTIIGVTPAAFTGEVVGMSPDIWIPLSMHDVLRPAQRMLNSRNAAWLLLLGRLKPGATIEQASKEIPALIERHIIANATPDERRSFTAGGREHFVTSGAKGLSSMRPAFQAPLLTLMAGVGLLLCIICANVATLLLARAVARGREMAVRLALGAGQGRLVRQVLTESVVLALLAAGAGMVVAWWGSRGLLILISGGFVVPIDVGMNVRMLAFTLGVSVLAVGLFGLAPALRASRVDLASSMRANAHAIAGGGTRLGKTLIAAQVALSVVLLVGAAMLVRSVRNLQTGDVGMDREHLVIVNADITSRSYSQVELTQLARTISARLSSLPGVAGVAFSENGIFSGTDNGTNVNITGFIARTADDTTIAFDLVSAGYANAIGARIIAGRDLAAIDEGGSPRTALVNQSFASFYFPNTTAIGRYMRFDDSAVVQIVGVIADTRDHHLIEQVDRRAYLPYVQSPDSANGASPDRLRFAVRTIGEPSAMVQAIRRATSSVDPLLPIDSVEPLTNLMLATIGQQRLLARLATAFGVLALLLAAFGLYGVMTYAIARRTGEIGVRVALGARRTNVVSMVLGDALRLVAIGVAIGLPFALASMRLLRAQLHDVALVDPTSIWATIVVLGASAVVASVMPALRASRVSPVEALRTR